MPGESFRQEEPALGLGLWSAADYEVATTKGSVILFVQPRGRDGFDARRLRCGPFGLPGERDPTLSGSGGDGV